jgi:hypothetical protein
LEWKGRDKTDCGIKRDLSSNVRWNFKPEKSDTRDAVERMSVHTTKKVLNEIKSILVTSSFLWCRSPFFMQSVSPQISLHPSYCIEDWQSCYSVHPKFSWTFISFLLFSLKTCHPRLISRSLDWHASYCIFSSFGTK